MRKNRKKTFLEGRYKTERDQDPMGDHLNDRPPSGDKRIQSLKASNVKKIRQTKNSTETWNTERPQRPKYLKDLKQLNDLKYTKDLKYTSKT